MPLSSDEKTMALSNDVLQALDNLSGVHPGHRPAHAKGILFSGVFTASPQATELTRAPHIQQESTPVTIRFSNSTGIPNIPDNAANAASPRGFAVRFHLGEHQHTDIIAHSHNGFPTHTAEEFLEFLRAVAASNGVTTHPTPIEAFLSTHPRALEFVQTPKPIPTSFAKEAYFGVNAFKFTNSDGETRYGRYRIIPVAGNEHLDDAAAAEKSQNFLFDEIVERVKQESVQYKVLIQLAEDGDTVDDATAIWPEERALLELGTIVLTEPISNVPDQSRIIFDPIPRVDGIDPSADPLLDPRGNIYLLSGRRRRAALDATEQ